LSSAAGLSFDAQPAAFTCSVSRMGRRSSMAPILLVYIDTVHTSQLEARISASTDKRLSDEEQTMLSMF
jgi:hypothetical protein